MAEMVWVWDAKSKQWVQKPAPANTSGKGVTVRPNTPPSGGGGTTVRPTGGPGTTVRPTGSKDNPLTPIGGGASPVPVGVKSNTQIPADALAAIGGVVPSSSTAGVPQGPGQWGPIGSAAQAYGMLKNQFGFDGQANTPTTMDQYSPLGDFTTLVKSLLSSSGSGGGGSGSGTKPTISRAALKKALTSAKNEISQAYNTAGSAIGSSFANNPYAGLTAQETTADPGLSALFQSQGVSPTDLEQMVGASREAASQRAAGMNDLYKLLGANYSQNAAAQQAGIQAQRASSLDDLLQKYAAILGSGKVY